MIKEFPVKWSIERFYCETCGEEMRRIEEKIKDGPPYEHECKNGHKATNEGLYPALCYDYED